jgi:hypothetical protein
MAEKEALRCILVLLDALQLTGQIPDELYNTWSDWVYARLQLLDAAVLA